MTKLTAAEIKTGLATTRAWKKKRNAIQRTFEWEDFAEAMKFVNAVARAAEKADHHPDIDIRWNKVTMSLSTHSAGGLTANDFDMARKIDRLAKG
jgi:4a-hydroxytetrahydrobiopterin dehydratase